MKASLSMAGLMYGSAVSLEMETGSAVWTLFGR